MTIAHEPLVTPAIADGAPPSTCAGCAAPLAADQRYCVGCGLRCAPDELRLAALPAMAPAVGLPTLGTLRPGDGRERPFARSAAVTAVVVLSLGIGIGATIGPAAVGETAAAQRPVIVLAAAAPAASTIAPALSAPLDDLSSSAADEALSEPAAGEDAATPAGDAPAEPAAGDPSADAGPQGDTADPAGHGDDPTSSADVAPPGSKALAGVVVAVGAAGEGFTLAERSGTLLAVHASGCGVAPGDDLHLRARKLANGTWSADRVRRIRDGLPTARALGVVSWVDPAGGRYALVARGTTLLVTVADPAATASDATTAAPPAPQGPPATAVSLRPSGSTPDATAVAASATATATASATASADASATAPDQPAAAPAAPAPTALPAIGDHLRVRVQLQAQGSGAPPSLLERARTALAPQDPTAATVPPLELAGAIVSVDPQARTVVLALDAATPPTATVTISAPPALDLTRLLPAARVAATATLAPDGTYALTGTSADDDAASADDATTLQGDQAVGAPSGSDTAQTVPAACTVL